MKKRLFFIAGGLFGAAAAIAAKDERVQGVAKKKVGEVKVSLKELKKDGCKKKDKLVKEFENKKNKLIDEFEVKKEKLKDEFKEVLEPSKEKKKKFWEK